MTTYADLVAAYPQRPLASILGDLVTTQDTVFTLLEARRRPEHARQLYLLGGVLGGLLAKASHDMADPAAALAQSRTAYLCADQADHDGLRAWVRGLQALITYWDGRLNESVRYAQQGAQFAQQGNSTAAVWLPVSEAQRGPRSATSQPPAVRSNTPRSAWENRTRRRARRARRHLHVQQAAGSCITPPTRSPGCQLRPGRARGLRRAGCDRLRGNQ